MSVIGDILKQINTYLLTITDIKVSNLWVTDPSEVSSYPLVIVRSFGGKTAKRLPRTDYQDYIYLDVYNTGGVEGVTTLSETIQDIFIKDPALVFKCHDFSLILTTPVWVSDENIGHITLKYELSYSRDYPITP
jgi:hypothetical protein